MRNPETVLQHYAQSEQDFVKQCLAFQQAVLKNGRLKVTGFLTLREQEILQTVIGHNAHIVFDGGINASERKIAIISEHDFIDVSTQVAVLVITYNQRFANLQHGDVLGAILGLGLERNTVGDIVFTANEIFVAVKKTMSKYVIQHLQKIGRHTVQVAHYEKTIEKQAEIFNDKLIYVQSLRLDSLVSHVLPCNREEAKTYINKEFVQVNWVATQNINHTYAVGDVISIRRFGRIYIDAIDETKRNRFKITLRTT